ncbi:hypothetical protein ACVWZ1_002948 [Thermostichus sp. MS-CIW-25]
MDSNRAVLIEVPLGAGLEFPIGPGLEFAHRYTQSQAVVPAYRGSLGRGAFLTPPAHRRGVSALCWEAMEGQEKRKPSLAELYHAVVRAVGTLLPPGEERKRPAVRLEGGGLEGEMSLKRKRLSPAAGKSLRKTLSRHPEGTAVGLTLWPRTREGRLDLAASQVGHLYVRPRPELAGTFSVLGLPKSWEPGEGRLVLEVRPNREGILPKPFALELLVPPALRPSVPPVGEEEALRVQGRVVEGLLVVEEVEKVPPPPEREGGAAKGDDPPTGRRRREKAGPSGGVG